MTGTGNTVSKQELQAKELATPADDPGRAGPVKEAIPQVTRVA